MEIYSITSFYFVSFRFWFLGFLVYKHPFKIPIAESALILEVCVLIIHFSTPQATKLSHSPQVELEVEMDKLENEQKVFYLRQLQELGVDMTQYMLAIQEEFVPEKEIVVGPAAKEVSIN